VSYIFLVFRFARADVGLTTRISTWLCNQLSGFSRTNNITPFKGIRDFTLTSKVGCT